jgi:hypothetical protein
MSIINNIDPKYNFWEIYPDLSIIEEFKKIQKDYKKSSDIMWFIVLCFDLDSKYINLPIEERTELLSKDYLKDKDWYRNNHTLIADAVKMYENLTDTTSRRQLRQLKETMEKRTKFLRETEYDLDNFEKLDKMASNTANLFKVLEAIEKQLSKEEGIGATKGGHELSLADQDSI